MAASGSANQVDMRAIAERRFFADAVNNRTNKGRLGHPRNIIKRFLHLCSTAGSSNSSDEALQQEVDAFVNEELAHLKLALDCKELEIRMAHEGMQHLQRCQAELQGQVQEVEAQIAASQQELERSKVFKQRQEEYELLKGRIAALPPRAATEADIAKVQAEIEELMRESGQLDRDIALRRKQFAHLSVVLQDLAASIRERAPADAEDAKMEVD